MKTRFRIISLIMFIIAVVFVMYALSHPELGTSIRIGNIIIGYKEYLLFYGIYIAVMIILFVSSFFIKEKK